MSGRLAGKVAVITGSGSGIGQSIAIRFASEGATVVVDYRSHPEQADDTKAKAEAAGGKAITIQADVSILADTQRLIDAVPLPDPVAQRRRRSQRENTLDQIDRARRASA